MQIYVPEKADKRILSLHTIFLYKHFLADLKGKTPWFFNTQIKSIGAEQVCSLAGETDWRSCQAPGNGNATTKQFIRGFLLVPRREGDFSDGMWIGLQGSLSFGDAIGFQTLCMRVTGQAKILLAALIPHSSGMGEKHLEYEPISAIRYAFP